MTPNKEPAFLLGKVRIWPLTLQCYSCFSVVLCKTETLWRFLTDRQLRTAAHEMLFGFSLSHVLARKTKNFFLAIYLYKLKSLGYKNKQLQRN